MSNLIKNTIQNEHLTTDAMPDAPRKNSETEFEELNLKTEIEESNSSDENKNQQSELNTDNESSQKVYNSFAPKAKKKLSSKTKAYTKVITIKNSTGIHFGNVNNYNLYSNANKQKNNEDVLGESQSNIIRTQEIDKFLASEDLVKREDLNLVSTHLGEGWRDIGTMLGYSQGQIDHFWEDNKNIGIKEVVYQMLLDWSRANPDKAKIGSLSTVLWNANQKDVVCRWMNIL